jgi:hypothetical protein
MKTIILAVAAVLMLVAFAVPVQAIDLGAGISLDAKISGGKPFSVTTHTDGEIQNLNVKTREDQYYLRSEIGVTYGIFRPFVYYEVMTHDFNTKSAGLDIAVYSTSGITTGVWGAYVFNQRLGVDSRKMGMAGIFVGAK